MEWRFGTGRWAAAGPLRCDHCAADNEIVTMGCGGSLWAFHPNTVYNPLHIFRKDNSSKICWIRIILNNLNGPSECWWYKICMRIISPSLFLFQPNAHGVSYLCDLLCGLPSSCPYMWWAADRKGNCCIYCIRFKIPIFSADSWYIKKKFLNAV